MDFVSGLPLTPTKKDSVWVAIDRLTKSTHFVRIRTDYSLQKLAKLYVSKIVRLHGCWEEHLPMVEFGYNNSFRSSIQMAPYEALYGRKCCSPLCVIEVSERKLIGPVSTGQKSYADLKHKDIEFNVGDFVFLKVSPWNNVLRFG
ncbi:uncharacterized protein [Gossypium hirsutum]|uniref:DNA/RNA polymerases superfamily protein n=1 Tax=Gossypium hirsutum TaxID=3635 RepID=A0A1U8ITQ6_GOSHI|nr:uncharacterized protein LOC107898298 [Gossypium hirsutum]